MFASLFLGSIAVMLAVGVLSSTDHLSKSPAGASVATDLLIPVIEAATR